MQYVCNARGTSKMNGKGDYMCGTHVLRIIHFIPLNILITVQLSLGAYLTKRQRFCIWFQILWLEICSSNEWVRASHINCVQNVTSNRIKIWHYSNQVHYSIRNSNQVIASSDPSTFYSNSCVCGVLWMLPLLNSTSFFECIQTHGHFTFIVWLSVKCYIVHFRGSIKTGRKI